MLIKPVFPVFDYLVNYEYISTQLCENIEKPKLECNGKCYLAKELAKASESDKGTSPDKKSKVKFEVELLFFELISNHNNLFNSILDIKELNTRYENFYISQVTTSLFHPPAFNC
jgi:hypothetical protein